MIADFYNGYFPQFQDYYSNGRGIAFRIVFPTGDVKCYLSGVICVLHDQGIDRQSNDKE